MTCNAVKNAVSVSKSVRSGAAMSFYAVRFYSYCFFCSYYYGGEKMPGRI